MLIALSVSGFARQDSSVPFRLKAFSAIKAGEDVQLKWAVACNLDFANFDILRSNDGLNFTSINSFSADRLRCLQPFDYIDRSAYGNVYYRIKVQDKDGNNSLEKTIAATGKQILETTLKVIYPIGSISIMLEVLSSIEGSAELIVFNNSGAVVKSAGVALIKGVNNISISSAAFSAGIYTVTLISPEGKKSVRLLQR